MDATATRAEIDAADNRFSALHQSGDVSSYQAATRQADADKPDRLREEREKARATLADLHAAVLDGVAQLDALPTLAPSPEPGHPTDLRLGLRAGRSHADAVGVLVFSFAEGRCNS